MRYFILIICIFFTGNSFSQHNEIYTTQRISNAPKIDGIINDNCWNDGHWEGNFTQREPHDGEKPSQNTEFKLLYDDNYIYVAIKSFDNQPDKIDSRMTRRDQMDGDLVAAHFDSYFDKRTSFSFFVNAGGVKSDVIFSNGGEVTDENWNPIWWVKTSKDSLGWYAEMKIPLSQLRFSKDENKIWGFEVSRYIYRSKELSLWKPIPQAASSWVYSFGELHGISYLKPKRIVEVAPYVSGGLETYEQEVGNPFAPGSNLIYRAGVDGKVGITNDFVLDFTINPDFGQVEADPSEVNLTAFETYFRERRPFFIEGSNILNYKVQPGDHESARDNLFYSRRIGRHPQYYPEITDSEYVDFPQITNILGALKITGKTQNGLSVGIMESVTREEKAEIASGENRSEVAVEPLTNYFVSRVQKDFDGGNTIVGGEFTSTNRKLHSPLTLYLPKNAFSGGVDFAQYWKDRKYFFTFKSVASSVNGDSAAITELQISPQHYFQRPDAEHITFNSSLTSLSGFGGNVSTGKNAESGFTYNFNLSWRSPGLALNDMGYLRVSDKISQILMLGYKWTKPTTFYRNIDAGIIQWNGWDFGGNSIFHGGMGWVNTMFNNLYTLVIRGSIDYGIHDNNMLRGGPAFSSPGNSNFRINLESNTSRKLFMDFGTYQGFGQYGSQRGNSWDMGMTYRPIDALSIKFDPNFRVSYNDMQYVEEYFSHGDSRYILAKINQSTLHFRFRINFNITPDLTIQYFGSPFISTGKYSEFKVVTNPSDREYTSRFHQYSNSEIQYDSNTDSYIVDENGDGNTDFIIENPDFEFKQFQSNLVIRWEYTPGSAIYLVWNQSITNYDGMGTFEFSNDLDQLFSTIPHNVFLIKFSYRFMR